eukprot:TRINITY_DN45936_c0_g1_i1.p1 TRINITY_DN45936_c0_g1~~TRINITY_DN45936_c0_g1_i1.p1  ORF type:complete len:1124 (-),score=212.01 TRINITY_DN45936_c0_g1_i1:40-3411(-)
MDPGFISNHLDKEEFYYSSPESLLTILNILDKNNIVPNRFTKVYQDLQDKHQLPDHDFEQELDDNNSFLSIAINSAVKDLENQEVDETFSSYILQPEPITDSSQYGPYRHPSGTDLVPYKQSVIDSGMLAIDPPYISPNNDVTHNPVQPKQDETSKQETASDKNIVENHQFLNPENELKSNMRIVPNVTYQDQSSSMLFPQTKNMLTHNSAGNSPVPQAIPSPISTNQIAFREPTQEAELCIDQYKPIGLSQTSQMSNEYYRVSNGNAGYVTNSIKCSENNSVYRHDQTGRTDTHNLATEMYHNHGTCRSENMQGEMYREDNVRNIEYPGDMYRAPTVSYSSNMDTYRTSTSCAQTQYDNYRIPEDASLVRSEYVQPYREANLISDEKTIHSSDGQTRLSMDRTDRLQNKTDFDFSTEYQILEQVINEHRMSEERIKYSADRLSTTKRYDPKHRALAQAFRKKEKNMALQDPIQEGDTNYFSCKQTSMESCAMSKPDQMPLEQIQSQEICKTELKHNSDCQYSKDQLSVPETKEQTDQVNSIDNVVERNEFIEADFSISVKDNTFIASEDIQQNPETGASSPTSLLQLSSCVQDPLQTPEKSDFYSCVQTDENTQEIIKGSNKSEPQQLFLTPKEKYAKELSALNQTTISFDINQGLEPEKTPTMNMDIEKEEEQNNATTPQAEHKVRLPSGLKILKSKKKMASQKRLILEHGEVRLTQKQRLKIRSSAKKLKANDIFQPTDCPDKLLTNYFTTERMIEESIDSDLRNTRDVPKKKIIINRKDKLLAEHRSQNQNIEEKHKNMASDNKDSHVLKEDKHANNAKNMLKCEKCTFATNSPNKLKLHEKVHSSNKEFVCPFCNLTSAWNKDHYQHIQEKHIPGPAPFKCPHQKCPYQNTKLQQVISHQSCHSENMPFSCQKEDCNFRTKSIHNLRKHEKNHSEQKFICDICQKSFGHRYTLDQHQAVHTDEKKFKCKLCTFSSKYSSHLAAHKRVHEGKVHRCNFEGCQYWTPKFTLLKAHIRAHNGDKCFKCESCGKGFVEAGQLKRHIKTHSEAKPFNCLIDDCTYSTNRKDKLKEHQGRSHKSNENIHIPEEKPKKRPSKLILNMISPKPQTSTIDLSTFKFI